MVGLFVTTLWEFDSRSVLHKTLNAIALTRETDLSRARYAKLERLRRVTSVARKEQDESVHAWVLRNGV